MAEQKKIKIRKLAVLFLALVMLFGAMSIALVASASEDATPVSVFDDGYELNANWIWANAEVQKEQWVSMRKTFTLDEVPEVAFARISADTKYWLWINGELAINEGQLALGDSRYTWYYDKEDISDYLVEGENTIAVQVYYAGKVSAATVNSTVPSFLFEAKIGDTLVCSDTTWRAVVDPAYEVHPAEEHRSLGAADIRYNAGAEMVDASGNKWTDKIFDDSAWAFAVNQDEKIRTNRIKNDDGENNKIYYQDTDPRTKLVLRSIPQWHFGELNKYTSSGEGGTGIYTKEAGVFAPLSLPGEYVVEAEVVAGTSGAAAISICVCVKDKDNFYMPQIGLKRSGSSGYDGIIFKPQSRISGSWKTLSNTNLTETEFGKTVYDSANGVDNRFETKYTVRIEVGASDIKTYMNGTLLGTMTNTSLTREGSTVGFRQDVDEILRVYSFKVTDTSGNELYNANIDSYEKDETLPEFSRLHVENSNAGSKIKSNKVEVDSETGDKFVTVRNCRVGISNGTPNDIYTITNETNLQGTPYIKVKSTKGGEVIDIVSDSWQLTSIRHQYVTKAGEQTWEPLGWMNGYVFTFTVPETVEVLELGFRPSGYMTEQTGLVTTDNDVLNQIYREAVDTLYVCMRDTYMDCPDRERSQWWGDTVSNMQQATYVMDDNAALLYTKTLKQVVGFVKANGALPSKVANGRDDLELPVQSLAGVHSFWQYYLYSGNEELLFEAYPVLIDYLEMWTMSVNGVISHRPGNWDWIDWGDHPDITIIENCWYYIALSNVLKIANLEGSGATEEEIEFLTSRMDRMEKNFDALYWDDNKNAYYWETDNGKVDDRANALAVYTGLADESRYNDILNVLTSTYNASPYMEKYVLESMYLMDAADEAIARTLKRYTPLAEDGYPTLPEYWVIKAAGTKNHAWTGGPLSMMYMYNAGITPLTPEFKTFSIRPQLGTLTSVNAYTEQGCGKIEVIAAKSAESFTLTVVVPVGAESALVCVPRLEGIDTMVKLGDVTIYADGKAASTMPSGISYAGEDVKYINFLVPAGEYTFTASENVAEESDNYSFVIGSCENAAVIVNGAYITAFPYTYTGVSGANVSVVITPDEGYRAVAITGSAPETVISRDAVTREYTLNGNITFNAVLEEAAPEYKKVSIEVSDADMARYAVSAYVNGDLVSLPYKSVYPLGTSLNLTLVSACEDNYDITIDGKEIRTVDFVTSDDVDILVEIAQKSTVTEHAVSSVKVSKSSSNQSTWDETNLYDGIRVSETDSLGYSTGFTSSTTSVTITYDLGSVQCVNQIALFPRTDIPADDPTLSCSYPTDFTVSVSTDGSTYTTVLTVNDVPNPKFKQQTYNFPSVYNARYVKLTVTGVGLAVSGQSNYYLQLAEFDVYYNSLLAVDDTLSTPYGPITNTSLSDASKYPFALFMDGVFKNAYTHWANTDDSDATADNKDVIQYAKNLLQGSKGVGKSATIYLRRDYTLGSTSYSVKDGTKVNETFGNYGQIGGTLVVDLGGHTLNLGPAQFLAAQTKKTSGVCYDTTIKFMNGTIELNTKSFISYKSSTSYDDSKNFNFTFDNVTFVLPKNTKGMSLVYPSTFDGTATVKANVEFNNCTFDYSAVTAANAAFTLFNLNNAELDATVTVKGGRFIANADSFDSITLSSLGDNGEVKFVKGDNGEYMQLYMPAGDKVASKAFPTDSADKYFVRTGSDIYGGESWSVYSLGEKSLGEFVPKMSITLDRELVMNVYVPVNASLQSIALDGKKYTDLSSLDDIVTIDGEDYYHLSLAIPASAAARAVKLVVTISTGDSVRKGTFTFSIPKYAEKVIAGGAEIEIQLVKDVLSYIRAAYAYFDKTDAEQLAKIDAILGENYDESNAPALNGSADAPSTGLKDVTYILNATPTVRFYITGEAESYKFYVNGNKLKTLVGTDENGTYIDMDVYAYAMAETITYTIDGVTAGSYHINSYYTFVTTDEAYKDNAELINLVARFAKYCESAAEYRKSVLSNS